MSIAADQVHAFDEQPAIDHLRLRAVAVPRQDRRRSSEPPNQSSPSGAFTRLSFETRVLAASACSCVQSADSGSGPSRDSSVSRRRFQSLLPFGDRPDRRCRWPPQSRQASDAAKRPQRVVNGRDELRLRALPRGQLRRQSPGWPDTAAARHSSGSATMTATRSSANAGSFAASAARRWPCRRPARSTMIRRLAACEQLADQLPVNRRPRPRSSRRERRCSSAAIRPWPRLPHRWRVRLCGNRMLRRRCAAPSLARRSNTAGLRACRRTAGRRPRPDSPACLRLRSPRPAWRSPSAPSGRSNAEHAAVRCRHTAASRP